MSRRSERTNLPRRVLKQNIQREVEKTLTDTAPINGNPFFNYGNYDYLRYQEQLAREAYEDWYNSQPESFLEDYFIRCPY